MREVRLKAMAKINLGLDVVRKREDGYHEVRMIMQTIRMYDQIRLRAVSEAGIKVRTNLSYLPCNEDNLVHKAAKLLMEEFEVREGLSIELKKYIPVAAGMAGGSSDAAAVMVGVNRMFGLGLTKAQLMERGVKIGADVPYCIMRGTVLAEGIGEILTPLPPMPKCHVLIAKPGIHVSTKFVYGGLHLDEVTVHPDIDGQAAAIKACDLNEAARLMGNVLESVTVSTYPVIDEIKGFMVQHGALGAMMSGSGPTVFGLFEDERTAKRAYEKLRRGKLAKQVFLTSIFNIGGNTNER